MLEELLLIKPDDPIEFLIKLLANSGCDNGNTIITMYH